MTRGSARTVANLILASAGLAAAYVVLTTPSLRRVAFRGVEFIPGPVPEPGSICILGSASLITMLRRKRR